MSGIELAIILVFAFLIFGQDKLPGVIKNVTHIWNSLKGLREQADQVIKAEVVEPLKDMESTINPFVGETASATDKLASKLGLKTDAPKKQEKTDVKETEKTENVVAESGEASGAAVTAAPDKKASSEIKKDETVTDTPPVSASAKTVSASTAKIEEKPSEAQAKPAPRPKPQTESFAEKKARLEREHRQKQSTEPGNTAQASTDASKSSASSETVEK